MLRIQFSKTPRLLPRRSPRVPSLAQTDESEDSLSRSLAQRDQETGADRARTGDPRLAKPVLSQLSYSPV
jgi:hypothetical protein